MACTTSTFSNYMLCFLINLTRANSDAQRAGCGPQALICPGPPQALWFELSKLIGSESNRKFVVEWVLRGIHF